MPTGIYIRTEYHKNILSAAHRGKPKSAKWIKNRLGKGNSCWRGGQTKHEYTCQYCGDTFYKICCPKKPKYKYCSGSCASKGFKRTAGWYEKVSKSLKKRYKAEGLVPSAYRKFTKQLKLRIRVRDNFKCRECGIPELECVSKLDVHHIDYNKKNYEETNLISLCKSCHTKTNFNRKQWQQKYSVQV